jgi:GDPmannose 4,6-dehydratase
VADACRIAFAHAGLDWQEHVVSDEALLRPTEITVLQGDYSLAKNELGWQPRTSFEALMQLMVDADLAQFR